jgi:hypothetical protein
MPTPTLMVNGDNGNNSSGGRGKYDIRLKLTWTPSTSTTVVRQKVEWTNNGETFIRYVPPAVSSIEVTVSEGQTVTMKVTAIDGENRDASSTTATIDVPEPATVNPDTNMALAITDTFVDESELTATWTKTASTISQRILFIKIPSRNFEQKVDIATNAGSHVFRAPVKCTVEVYTWVQNGTSSTAQSNTASKFVPRNDGPPAAPTNPAIEIESTRPKR